MTVSARCSLQANLWQVLTGNTQMHCKHTHTHTFVCTQTKWLKRRVCPYLSVGNGTALWAHRSPDLAALRSGVEILSGHVDGKSLHSALDPNLNIESKLMKSTEKESQK